MSTNQTETELKVMKLKTNDGEMFEMAVEEALQSRTLKNMVEEKCDGVIPISNLTGPILSKVIDYCKKHAAAAAGDKEANDGLKDWDADFVKVDLNTLFDLIVAANYLDIAGLLDLTCQTVADMISGKTAEEVRESFNIENDFTPEEEEKIRKENQWAFM